MGYTIFFKVWLLSFFFVFQTGSCYVAQVGLKLMSFLSLPSAEITGRCHQAQFIYHDDMIKSQCTKVSVHSELQGDDKNSK
jgi:hypothetical protein